MAHPGKARVGSISGLLVAACPGQRGAGQRASLQINWTGPSSVKKPPDGWGAAGAGAATRAPPRGAPGGGAVGLPGRDAGAPGPGVRLGFALRVVARGRWAVPLDGQGGTQKTPPILASSAVVEKSRTRSTRF